LRWIVGGRQYHIGIEFRKLPGKIRAQLWIPRQRADAYSAEKELNRILVDLSVNATRFQLSDKLGVFFLAELRDARHHANVMPARGQRFHQ
jgi:hypothetical protein